MTRIRVFEKGDVASLTALLLANREYLAPWEPRRGDAYFTIAEQKKRAAVVLTAYGAGTCIPFVILDELGELIGALNLNAIVAGAFRSCALSYWVRHDRARQGHATAAVQCAIKHAFDDLNLHRIQAETRPENVSSQRVLRKAGFSLIGVAPKFLHIDGAWRDHLLFQTLGAD